MPHHLRVYYLGLCILAVSFAAFCAQSTSSVQFYDSTGLHPTASFGWRGNSISGLFFIEDPAAKGFTVQNGNLSVDGTIQAASFAGNLIVQGSATATRYYKGGVEFDSVKTAAIADSSKRIPDASITSSKISSSLKLRDENIDSVSWTKIKSKPDLNSLSGSLAGTRVDPNFSGRSTFLSDTLTKQTPGAANRIDMYNSAINLIGFPIIAGAPAPGNSDYGMMFGKPEGYTGINADQTTFYFRAAIKNSGTTTMALSDNLIFHSTYNDSNSAISTNSGCLNIVPKNGVLKVNGVAVYSSDSALKTNVVTIDSAAEKIDQLRGVYFDFKSQEYPDRNLPTRNQIGVIAQDVEKVFPQLVYVDKEGFKSVAYDRLSAILIEVVKSQNRKLAEQQQTINNLMLQQKSQQEEIDQIKSTLGIDK